jgi:RHS repeat-associated protein
LQVSYSDGTATQFEYNQRSELIRTANEVGSWSFDLNLAGLADRVTQRAGGHTDVVDYQYDVMRRPIQLGTSLGHRESWSRDARGRAVTQQLDGRPVQFEYDDIGREKARSLAGGGRIERTNNGMGVPSIVRVRSPYARPAQVGPKEPEWIGRQPEGTILSRGYSYSPGSTRLLSVWDSEKGEKRYAYDDVDRLLAVTEGDAALPQTTFAYDARSNIVNASGAPRSYDDGNRLLAAGNEQLEWDERGRLSRRVVRDHEGLERVWQYEWSARHLLDRVTTPNGDVVAFAYDPFARRVARRVLRATPDGQVETRAETRWIWDRGHIVHEVRRQALERGDPVSEEVTFAWDDDALPLAQRTRGEGESGAWNFFVTDPIGVPEVLVDDRGTITGRVEREPWGKVDASTGQALTPLRLPGQYADHEIGLHYNRYRYYDPRHGIYVQPDPAGLADDPNVYRYCINPIVWDDPLGLVHFAHGTFTPASGGPPILLGTNGALDSKIDAGSKQAGTQMGLDLSKPEDRRKNLRDTDANGVLKYRVSDTETKGLRELEALEAQKPGTLKGGTVHLVGELPPCSACHKRMQEFAKDNKCKVIYDWKGRKNKNGDWYRKPGSHSYPQ